MLTFPFGVTVAIVRPGTPGFGGDPGTPQPDRNVDGCVVYPGDSVELTSGRDTVTADLTAIVPTGTDVEATDQVRYDGQLYDIDGAPERYVNPFTGTDPGIVLRLRRSAG